MIIESNNKIQMILLESDNGKDMDKNKILSQIQNIIAYEKIVFIEDEQNLLLLRLNTGFVGEKINYCKIIERCKRYY